LDRRVRERFSSPLNSAVIVISSWHGRLEEADASSNGEAACAANYFRATNSSARTETHNAIRARQQGHKAAVNQGRPDGHRPLTSTQLLETPLPSSAGLLHPSVLPPETIDSYPDNPDTAMPLSTVTAPLSSEPKAD
jgi:hypothetical protein